MSTTLPDGVWRDATPFPLDNGAVLPGITLAWKSWGRLNAAADNAVIVCHALTGDADAARWWAPLFGPGKALDPTRDFIVCSNVLGGCAGSSGPTSMHPDGEAWGGRFPAISVRDQVRAQIRLADALGIRRIRLVLGGSMGGLQALEWALLDPARVGAVASVAASASHSAWCLALNEAQRMALRADPDFLGGFYPAEAGPIRGLAAARAVAMVSYRSAGSLQERFGRQRAGERFGHRANDPDVLAAASWVRHHGETFVDRFDANSYLRLLDAMDGHDIGRGRGGIAAALASIDIPVLVVTIPSDVLYPSTEQFALFEGLPRARLARLDSIHGHDGFLIDADRLEPLLRQFGEPRTVTRRANENEVAA